MPPSMANCACSPRCASAPCIAGAACAEEEGAEEEGADEGGGDKHAWCAKKERRARAVADITAAARAELQEAEARNPQESQSVRLTILMGAEVAAQWRAEREAKRGEEREQLRELVTTVVQVPREEEPRVISRDIPETLGDMVKKARSSASIL